MHYKHFKNKNNIVSFHSPSMEEQEETQFSKIVSCFGLILVIKHGGTKWINPTCTREKKGPDRRGWAGIRDGLVYNGLYIM